MCIICEASPDHLWEASDFLSDFDHSRRSMQKAAAGMLTMSKTVANPTARKRYDRTYKAMVRIMKDWNSLEEAREKA